MTDLKEAPAVQQSLLIQERPVFDYRMVDVNEVLAEPWGSPPDDALIRDIALVGVLQPVMFTENGEGKLRIREGRRRFQAAVANGFDQVPGLVLENDLGAGVYALELAGNAFSSQNPIADLVAIEEIQVATGEDDLIEVARMTAIPLNTIKKRARLRALIGDLRDAGMEGKMTTPVVMAAASLDIPKQQKLLEPLRANGKITMADVQALKATTVRQHQRKLPGTSEAANIVNELHSLRGRAYLEFGGGEYIEVFDKLLELVTEKVETSE